MLIPSLVLAIIRLSAASTPLFRPFDGPLPNQVTLQSVPGEPSTLALGLIGVSIAAAYVILTRRARSDKTTQLRPAGSFGRDRTTPPHRRAA